MTHWRRLAVTTLLMASLIGAVRAQTIVHGSADAYAGPGVSMAWAIKRGANEASTAVVVRVVNDATTPWMAVGGIDPFTKQEQGLVLARPVDVRLDVRIPRTQFGDTPRTEWMFYPSERAAKAGSPSIIVYYLGVPDTTPEFTDEAKLDAYLDDRLVRARAARGRAP